MHRDERIGFCTSSPEILDVLSTNSELLNKVKSMIWDNDYAVKDEVLPCNTDNTFIIKLPRIDMTLMVTFWFKSSNQAEMRLYTHSNKSLGSALDNIFKRTCLEDRGLLVYDTPRLRYVLYQIRHIVDYMLFERGLLSIDLYCSFNEQDNYSVYLFKYLCFERVNQPVIGDRVCNRVVISKL